MVDLAGSIPAGAGEPSITRSAQFSSEVYPRGCGGTRDGRGRSGRRRVYPRGCGGTVMALKPETPRAGLSPRVRGNHPAGSTTAGEWGSIPAGAGEPGQGFCGPADRGVYPRGCGGTGPARVSPSPRGGLSPRVRGNLEPAAGDRRFQGSIPAGAGEPPLHPRPPGDGGVYPRGCGGTSARQAGQTPLGGLSPRVRGNLIRSTRGDHRTRSIPAGAGEPGECPIGEVMRRVYPRGCGGTSAANLPQGQTPGLWGFGKPRAQRQPMRETKVLLSKSWRRLLPLGNWIGFGQVFPNKEQTIAVDKIQWGTAQIA